MVILFIIMMMVTIFMDSLSEDFLPMEDPHQLFSKDPQTPSITHLHLWQLMGRVLFLCDQTPHCADWYYFREIKLYQGILAHD